MWGTLIPLCEHWNEDTFGLLQMKYIYSQSSGVLYSKTLTSKTVSLSWLSQIRPRRGGRGPVDCWYFWCKWWRRRIWGNVHLAEFFSSNYFQIGQHVVLLHILIPFFHISLLHHIYVNQLDSQLTTAVTICCSVQYNNLCFGYRQYHISEELMIVSYLIVVLKKHACVYIHIRQLSSYRAPTLWFIDLNITTWHIQYTFLSLCWFFFHKKRDKHDNTGILSFW